MFTREQTMAFVFGVLLLRMGVLFCLFALTRV